MSLVPSRDELDKLTDAELAELVRVSAKLLTDRLRAKPYVRSSQPTRDDYLLRASLGVLLQLLRDAAAPRSRYSERNRSVTKSKRAKKTGRKKPAPATAAPRPPRTGPQASKGGPELRGKANGGED